MAGRPGIVLSAAERQTRDMLYSQNPGTANRIEAFDPETVLADAREARIIVHQRYPALVQAFLDHKRQHGSRVEKTVYRSAEEWTWQDQVARLVKNRPLVFMNSSDHTVLRDGTKAGAIAAEWDRVGTSDESRNRHVRLADYLSYDEMMLGSLLAVSGPSHFINAGGRFNRGEPGAPGSFEPRGVIVGLVGARFERRDRMDSVFVRRPRAAPPRQHPELTRLFTDFFLTDRPGRDHHGGDGGGGDDDDDDDDDAPFDRAMYRARMRVAADLLLLEAGARARAAARRAYVHVVGLGLGVWAVDRAAQTDDYAGSFADALDALDGGGPAHHIGTLDFSWVAMGERARARLEAAAARRGVAVRVSRRDPAAALLPPPPPHDRDAAGQELLVVSYAWDGNALPGNEYWQGDLTASGDPAAACMSTISELHNPWINVPFLERIHVLEP